MITINDPFNEFFEGIKKLLAPYKEVQANIEEALKPFIEVQRNIKASIAPFDEFAKAFKPFIERAKEIEQEYGSVSNYLNLLIKERHKVLADYGWFYAFGISDDLADDVFNKRDSLTKSDVDTMVINHFNACDYAELSRIITCWNDSVYFTSRQHIFNEAFINHSHERFYSSVTLLSVHTEGIIRDFLRCEATIKRYFKDCINELTKLLNDQTSKNYFPNIERKVLFDFLTDVYNSGFWLDNPDLIEDPTETNDMYITSHNLSRNKIAHGHVVNGVSEVDSLKCFLYINALYHLFSDLKQDCNNKQTL